MKKEKKFKQKRKFWFRIIKGIIRLRYKRPNFVYLGRRFEKGGIIVSNHEGTDAPLSLELYMDQPIRFWGAHEMNSGLKALYKYQTEVYYHQKKHWSLFWARMFCLLASPVTYVFYKGLNLISTYHDARFAMTIKQSVAAIENGDNIVVFPEDSKNGYLPELEGFFAGFVMFAEILYKKKGIDAPIYISYFKKNELKYIVDVPVYYSELSKNGETREEIAQRLLWRCNALGKLDIDKNSQEVECAEAEECEV